MAVTCKVCSLEPNYKKAIESWRKDRRSYIQISKELRTLGIIIHQSSIQRHCTKHLGKTAKEVRQLESEGMNIPAIRESLYEEYCNAEWIERFVYDDLNFKAKLGQPQIEALVAGLNVFTDVSYEELVLIWGQGSGKSVTIGILFLLISAVFLEAFKEYKVLPYQLFNIPKSTITLLNVGYNETQSRQCFFDPLKSLTSPKKSWFWKYPHTEQPKPELLKSTITWKHLGLQIESGHSSQEGLTGRNLLICAFDEIDGFSYVRPAGRTHLGVKVPYRPGRGNC